LDGEGHALVPEFVCPADISGKMGQVRLTVKAVNEELAKRGHTARVAKADGYFYFQFGEAANWLDRTVRVPTVNALSLKQWMDEYQRLTKLNAEIFKTTVAGKKRKAH